MNLSPNQSRLVEVLKAAGGQSTSLFRLAVEAEIDYGNAWRDMRKLEAHGLVHLSVDHTRPGQPLVMRLMAH